MSIDRSQIKFRWFVNFYDHPLSGFGEYNGAICYWSCLSDDDFDANGELTYGLYRLTTGQIEAETERHREWERRVGTHSNMLENGRRDPDGALKPGWMAYFDEKKARPDQPRARLDSPDAMIGTFKW